MLKHETDKLEIYSFDSEYRKRNFGKDTSIPALGLIKEKIETKSGPMEWCKETERPSEADLRQHEDYYRVVRVNIYHLVKKEVFSCKIRTLNEIETHLMDIILQFWEKNFKQWIILNRGFGWLNWAV